MKLNITLHGEPKSTQHIYRPTCRGGSASISMTELGVEIKDSYMNQASADMEGLDMIEGDIKVKAVMFFGTKRKQDLDNFNKLFLDSLSGIAYEDDSQIQELLIIKRYDKENPRIEVEIEKI